MSGAARAGATPGDQARDEFSTLLNAKGHAVDNARLAVARLERAFAEGVLQPTPEMDEALADLRIALATDNDQRIGGKSAEAARFIGRRIERLLAAQAEGVRVG